MIAPGRLPKLQQSERNHHNTAAHPVETLAAHSDRDVKLAVDARLSAVDGRETALGCADIRQTGFADADR